MDFERLRSEIQTEFDELTKKRDEIIRNRDYLQAKENEIVTRQVELKGKSELLEQIRRESNLTLELEEKE